MPFLLYSGVELVVRDLFQVLFYALCLLLRMRRGFKWNINSTLFFSDVISQFRSGPNDLELMRLMRMCRFIDVQVCRFTKTRTVTCTNTVGIYGYSQSACSVAAPLQSPLSLFKSFIMLFPHICSPFAISWYVLLLNFCTLTAECCQWHLLALMTMASHVTPVRGWPQMPQTKMG